MLVSVSQWFSVVVVRVLMVSVTVSQSISIVIANISDGFGYFLFNRFALLSLVFSWFRLMCFNDFHCCL